MTSIRRVLAWAVVGLSVVGVASSNAEDAAEEVDAILYRHVGVYTTPPDTLGALDPSIKAYRIPDGPLMGNGDLAVAVGGTDRAQTFYLSKSDLSHSMRGLGGLTYTFEPTPADPETYRQEQDLYRSEVRSILPFDKGTVRMRSFTADAGNVLVTEQWTEGGAPIELTLKIWSHTNGSTTRAFTGDGIIGCTREISTTMGTTRQPFHSAVAVASRVLRARPVCQTDRRNSTTAGFPLDPGARVRVVTVAAGGYRATDPVSQAKARADGLDDRAIDAIHADHLAWWKHYWSGS